MQPISSRNIVPVSASDSITINQNATTAAQPGTIGTRNTGAELDRVLSQTSQQPPAPSKLLSLFSVSSSSSTLPGTLRDIQPTLGRISQQLGPALSRSKSASNAPAPGSTESKANPDWPYPDLGPRPFMRTPSGSGPAGKFNFNPTCFPTLATAKTIAQMLGGKVVAQDAILNAPGTPFTQNQPNYMVELPNGNIINPGCIAQAISQKQPRAMIDALIDSEMNNRPVEIGTAPPFVPLNSTPSAAASVDSNSSEAPSAAVSFAGSPSIDQFFTQIYSAPGTGLDDVAGSIRQDMESVFQMLQLLSRIAPLKQLGQPDDVDLRLISK